MTPLSVSLAVAVAAPGIAAVVLAVARFVRGSPFGERALSGALLSALVVSLAANVAAAVIGGRQHGEVDYGGWIVVGGYEVPAVLYVDEVSLAFAVLASLLTALVARFSQTYMHREPGFERFFLLLAMFATGTQLVAHAGALDVFFAGWELIGVASVLFIGFFHERDEPVRSSLRAFATYRITDLGFMLGIVATHEWIGSTRLSALPKFAELPPHVATGIAALFLIAAIGKSAQLPFSGWLARAMEGPTPSSALFYGGVSIHAGLFLLLRLRPVLEAAPIVAAVGVGIGVATAVYATLVGRAHPDAKGGLAHATLGQVGLILAEISLGFETLALVHLVGHAALRLYQYLRAPNRMHDEHRLGHRVSAPWIRHLPPFVQHRLYSAAVHRFRIDEWLDRAVVPVYAVARWLDTVDGRVRRAVSLDRGDS